MARPQPTKPTVNLSSNLASTSASVGPRPSRIRRDPPPAVKTTDLIVDAQEREQWMVIAGIIAFALAIFVVIIGFASYSGWSPSQYSVEIHRSE
ncbi:MAG: hypothetical protein ABIW03_05780 [Sphingomicrobium sp.]